MNQFNLSDKIQTKWNMHSEPQTCYIHDRLIQINNNSIWYSTDYNEGEQGMVEYNINTKTKNIVEYPDSIKPEYHCLCKYKNMIYIIDGSNHGEIIQFNPSTKRFLSKVKIDNIGSFPSAIVYNDQIYIFHGNENKTSKPLIYSPKTNSIRKSEDFFFASSPKLSSVCLMKYNNQMIRFGGFDNNSQLYIDQFLVSNNNNKWSEIVKFKLPQPMSCCGYVIFNNYIITFGGEIGDGKYIDDIYVLNLKNVEGWKKLKHIKCPIKSTYTAVVTEHNVVHLFQMHNVSESKGHFSIPLSMILPETNVAVDLEIDGDSKCGCSMSNNEYQAKLAAMTMNLRIKTIENEKLRKEKNEYIDKYEKIFKQLQEVQIKLNKFEHLKNYSNWSGDDIVDWLLSLDNGQYKQYENQLRKVFNEENVNGAGIYLIDKEDLRGWGLKDFTDRANICRHLKSLVQTK